LSESEKYRQKREVRRSGLQTFFLNVENNHFDFGSNKLITDLENKLSELEAQVESDIKEPGYMKHMEIYFLKKELFAISEMKILYSYKHFETHLKFLLKASYQEMKESRLYKWEFVEDFLKSKKINPKEISDYVEMCDFRNLNNAIKHDRNIIDNKTKNIKEFQNKAELKHTDLLEFYKRVENSGLNFLKSLSDEIDKDLYEFHEDRLDKISEKLVSRMDTKTINKLIEKLEKKK
jgi:hypothetical protein